MLRDDLVELKEMVAGDVQDVVDVVVEDGLVREKTGLDDCGCRQDGSLDVRQDGSLDVEVDVQDVVDVFEVDNVEHDVVEERGMLCSMIVDVEDLEDNVEVVNVAQQKVDEVDDVQDEVVSGKVFEKVRHDGDVRVEMPNVG